MLKTTLCAEKKNVMLGVRAVEGSMNLPNLLENNLACHMPKNINNSVLVFLPLEPLRLDAVKVAASIVPCSMA